MHALFISLLLASDAPAPDLRPVLTLELAKISLQDARRLKGQRVRVWFAANGPVTGEGDEMGILAVGTKMAPIPTYRFVMFSSAHALDLCPLRDPDRLTAEGYLVTRHLPEGRVEGFLREERWNIEVVGARWVLP
jgi:hypothetical protein